MTTERAFYDAPDPETLNILIELGQLVKNSAPIPLQKGASRTALLEHAKIAILAIKALRAHEREIREAGDVIAITEPTA